MKIEKIKPIPKYIQKLIQKYDAKYKTVTNARTRFYAYLTKNDGELVKVPVAVKEKSCSAWRSLGQMLCERYELHLHSRIYCWLACGRIVQIPKLVRIR